MPKSARKKLAQVVGLALLVYACSAWIGALRGATDPLQPLASLNQSATPTNLAASPWQTITSAAELDTQLALAVDENRPLLLDWYADWCISCKVIERKILNNPQLAVPLAAYRLVRLDVTESNAGQRALLNRFGFLGPPALLFFDRQGTEQLSARIIGEITTADFQQRLSALQTLH